MNIAPNVMQVERAARLLGVDMSGRLAERCKVVDAARAECYEVVDAARAERDAALAECYEVVDAARAECDEVVDAAWAECYKVVDAAWALLSCGDPLVDWIVAQCVNHRTEALIVLAALPATLADLDELALDQEWCPVWGHLRDKAVRAGVASG